MYYINIKYPKIFEKISIDLSSDRIKGMHKNYVDKDYYVGNLTKQYNETGILAELIAQYYLDTKEYNYKALSFLGTEPEVEADIKLNNKNIDVKYIPFYGKMLMVNHNSHLNKRINITDYMFIRPKKDFKNGYGLADIWIVKHKDVDLWDIEKHHTKVFFKNINN